MNTSSRENRTVLASNHKLLRAGVTILEVLFSIGIVVIGILGIASLLPLAARSANDSNEAAEGNAYARKFYVDFVTRGFNQSGRWLWYNDQRTSNRYAPFDNTSTVPTNTSVGSVRTAGRQAICIDPGFLTDATTLETINGSTFPSSQPYRPGLFPYYQDNFDPTSPPVSSASFLSVDNARLLRVTLSDATSSLPYSAKLVESLFFSRDDISIAVDEKDRSAVPSRIFDGSLSKSLATTQYSWLATLCPREPGPNEPLKFENKYTLSVVVLHRRNRAFFAPTGNLVDLVPQGERLCSVNAPSNFVGGSGGRVTLVANQAFDDSVASGDWLMLAKYLSPAPPRAIVCRWYRVIGTVDDNEFVPPAGTWAKSVILDGPDWNFSTGSPTQATLVDGVATVLERVISLQ